MGRVSSLGRWEPRGKGVCGHLPPSWVAWACTHLQGPGAYPGCQAGPGGVKVGMGVGATGSLGTPVRFVG